MPLQLPSDRVTLNVARDLGIRGSYPQDLRIKRQAKSKNLYAQWWLTPEDDPYEAGKWAIAWVQTKQRELREQKEEISAQREYVLSRYWERWFAREQLLRIYTCDHRVTPAARG